MKNRVWVVVIALLTGCPKPEDQSFLINHRDAALQVTYRGVRTGVGAPNSYCEIMQPWQTSEAAVERMLGVDDVNQNVAHEYDGERCEIKVTVPAHAAMWIAARDSCGYVQRNSAPPKDWPPALALLRIESAEGTIELSGWEVARAFKLERHLFRKDVCRLDLR